MKTIGHNKLQYYIFLLLFIFSPMVVFGQFFQLGESIEGLQVGDYSGFSVCMNNTGNRLVVGEVQDQNFIDHLGQVKAYEYTNGAWQQLGQTIEGNEGGRFFGYSVSMNGDGSILAIGNPIVDNGLVKIFQLVDSMWVQIGDDLVGQAFGDAFGQAIELDNAGNRIVIGSPSNNGNGNRGGRTQVYEYNNETWLQLGNPINGEFGLDYSGEAVSINFDGTIVAVGAKTNNGGTNNAGHVRIFQFNGVNWIQQGKDINGEMAGDLSGRSVSLNASGNIVAIGAADNDTNGTSSGQVRIFEFLNNQWVQLGAAINGENEFDNLGRALSLSGNGYVVGVASSFAGDSGLVKLYQYLGDDWLQVDETLLGENVGDGYGYSIILNSTGNTLAVGIPFHDGDGKDNGQVRVYSTESILSVGNFNKRILSIYPNPTKGKVMFDMVDGLEVREIGIIDISGKQIFKIIDKDTKEIDISGFTRGVYLIRFETNQGIINSKIIKI